MSDSSSRDSRFNALKTALEQRVLVLDGAAGTFIQNYKLTEEDFRGDCFKDWQKELRGNNDLLQLTRPDIIRDMHRAYLEAGADIIETNTFSSTTIAQADYAMEDIARDMNFEGAKLARAAADEVATQEKPRFVAGAIGPTNRAASLSPDVNDPGARNVDFDELKTAYREQIDALAEGGVDLFLLETITDTVNAKAAIFALEESNAETGANLPLIISVMIPDQSGRTLSGQTPEAFWTSVRHANPLAIGVNCSLGPDLMRPYVDELSRIADTYVSAYPNAGLPNTMGDYDETPESMSVHISEWLESGLLNIIGGCCGTTPAHIAAFAKAATGVMPRKPAQPNIALALSGLEPMRLAG
ncbi:homocysteine S-methyltransferase family protein [Parvularcula sp. IMCC14364]|uniref:homocysteine S-methyltransferase family protein n=1 Tax=Parvularcula sp. IMCC14364 TaxID=3067902 RepID=UPI00274142BF|nr:homocysteine S-methyltransferase family protein [Parvularcula sp. IMCC14364]